MKGMTTCKVCGRDFPLMIEEHYISRDAESKGVLPALQGQTEATQWDTFDCPFCGSQNVMQERKFMTCPCDFGICDECDHTGEEPEDHDGCKECAHEDVPLGEYPCNECKSSYSDMWERKEDDNG